MRTTVDGISFSLKAEQDFSWLQPYGKCIGVMDSLTTGNLCFLMDGPYGRLFIKYAGAQTMAYTGRVRDAVRTLRNAMPLYGQGKDGLIPLLAYGEVGEGFAAIFRYVQGANMHDVQTQVRLQHEPIITRLRMLDTLFALALDFSGQGLLLTDLCDDNVLIDFEFGHAMLCDIDQFRAMPYQNLRGRMPGTPRYLAPEEFRKGAELDDITNVYHLGVLAFDFFSVSHGYSEGDWMGPKNLYKIAARAVAEDRLRRFQSVPSFVRAWREAVGKAKFF